MRHFLADCYGIEMCSKKYIVKAFVLNEEMPAMATSQANTGNVTAAPTTIRRAPIKTIVKKSE